MNAENEIRQLLHRFQEGYTHRDIAQLEAFMQLFTADAEVIGTNASKPGASEWYQGREPARQLVEGDWRWWGDLRLDVESATIHARGDTGWLAATATVTKTIGEENYAEFLETVKHYLETSPAGAEEKLHFILRGGTNTVYELRRGKTFTWPLRFTAVVVRDPLEWKFVQMNFSFPTTHFPDVRILA